MRLAPMLYLSLGSMSVFAVWKACSLVTGGESSESEARKQGLAELQSVAGLTSAAAQIEAMRSTGLDPRVAASAAKSLDLQGVGLPPSGSSGTSAGSEVGVLPAEPPTLGVPSCDAYFRDLYACAAKLPTEARAAMLSPIQASLAGWKGMAQRADNRAALESDCAAKQQLMRASPLCQAP